MYYFAFLSGYDTLPIDSMQGLEIGSHGPGSNYGPMDVGGDSTTLDFDHLEDLPQPPQDSQHLAAWYDTDLWTAAFFIHYCLY